MPRRSTRKTTNVTKRRRQAAKLYEAGYTMPEIAARLGVVSSTISRDLEWVRKQWVSKAVEDVETVKKRELAEIDALQLEYEDAWRRSVGESLKTKTEYRGLDKEDESETPRLVFNTVEEAQELVGDPRFLNGIQWCIETRSKIWGIYAAQRVEATGRDGGPIETSNVVIYMPDNGRDK